MNAPIYNPIVPFNMGLTMRQGFMVYVNGVPTGGRFCVNFKTGPGPNSDMALHFNPRFDDGNVVVRNTCRGGRWEAEERSSNGFPFTRGQPFEIIFLCQPHQFKVAVNGRHFIEYRHRVPFQSIQYLQVEGQVTLSQIRFDQESTPFHFGGHGGFQQNPVASVPKVINNPSIPHKAVVPFNNMRGRSVTISGIPENRHPHKFMIDFQSGDANPDIFFHFNPRVNNHVLVRNTRLGGAWGGEERQLGVPFPFQYGVPYQLKISVDQPHYRVELNGTLICTYVHRKRPLNLIRSVNISGSTGVSRIAFE